MKRLIAKIEYKLIKYLYRKNDKKLSYHKLRAELRKKRKINVGSGDVDFSEEWFSCDISTLDITNRSNWINILGSVKLKNIFAEHVWEHLTEEDTDLANRNCYEFLKKNGRIRIAVPDGYHPNKDYIDYVKPNGNGIGSDDHKILYNYNSLSQKLKDTGFKTELLEYWDETGKFHFQDWSNDGGKVNRSRQFDSRNINGKLNYTSLIIDAIKI